MGAYKGGLGPADRAYVFVEPDASGTTIPDAAAGAADDAARWAVIKDWVAEATTLPLLDVATSTSPKGEANSEDVVVYGRTRPKRARRSPSGQTTTISIQGYDPSDTTHAKLEGLAERSAMNVVEIQISSVSTGNLVPEPTAAQMKTLVANADEATATGYFGYLNISRTTRENANADEFLEVRVDVDKSLEAVNQAA